MWSIGDRIYSVYNLFIFFCIIWITIILQQVLSKSQLWLPRLNCQIESVGTQVDGVCKKNVLGCWTKAFIVATESVIGSLTSGNEFQGVQAFWKPGEHKYSALLNKDWCLSCPSRQTEPPLSVMNRGQTPLCEQSEMFLFATRSNLNSSD